MFGRYFETEKTEVVCCLNRLSLFFPPYRQALLFLRARALSAPAVLVITVANGAFRVRSMHVWLSIHVVVGGRGGIGGGGSGVVDVVAVGFVVVDDVVLLAVVGVLVYLCCSC